MARLFQELTSHFTGIFISYTGSSNIILFLLQYWMGDSNHFLRIAAISSASPLHNDSRNIGEQGIKYKCDRVFVNENSIIF
jgi:hypothetical protein